MRAMLVPGSFEVLFQFSDVFENSSSDLRSDTDVHSAVTAKTSTALW